MWDKIMSMITFMADIGDKVTNVTPIITNGILLFWRMKCYNYVKVIKEAVLCCICLS